MPSRIVPRALEAPLRLEDLRVEILDESFALIEGAELREQLSGC